MKPSTTAKLRTAELVDHFVAVASAQDEALLHGDTSKYNVLYDEMDTIDKELRRRGTEARLALTGLYNHPNLQVRMKAAVHTLAIAPDAREVLQAIVDSKELPQALHAGMTLWNLDRGVFKPT